MVTRSITAALLLVLVLAACRTAEHSSSSAGEPGAMDAKRDLARGIIALENIGSPTLIPREVAEVLHQKYGIKVHFVAFDMHSDEEYQHVLAYNVVMEAEIERQFGSGVWDGIMKEIVKAHDSQRGAQ